MIRYQLTCLKSHTFEAWFASSSAFDVQAKKKLVTCPSCGSTKVTKALMAPNVVTSEQKTAARKKQALQRGQTQGIDWQRISNGYFACCRANREITASARHNGSISENFALPRD